MHDYSRKEKFFFDGSSHAWAKLNFLLHLNLAPLLRVCKLFRSPVYTPVICICSQSWVTRKKQMGPSDLLASDHISTFINVFDELKGDLMQHVEACMDANREWRWLLCGNWVMLLIFLAQHCNAETSTTQDKPACWPDWQFSTTQQKIHFRESWPFTQLDFARIVNTLLSEYKQFI